MTDDQKRILRKLVWDAGIRDSDGDEKMPYSPDYDTWQDLGDCKEALEKDGLWDEFHELTHDNTVASDGDFWNYDVLTEKHWSEFDKWLFRTTDENGEPHFCRLAAEFMEANNGS